MKRLHLPIGLLVLVASISVAGCGEGSGTSAAYGDAEGAPALDQTQSYRRDQLPALLEGVWDDPIALDGVVNSLITDGLPREAVGPARHLVETHPNHERATVLLGIALTQSDRADEAVELFEAFLEENGDSAYVLNNLAKTLTVMGRHLQAELVLWRTLEIDPNQENGLLWMETIHRERGGTEARRTALERAATFEGAWRPQLWLAQIHLEEEELDEAMTIYRAQLDTAVANDGLTAISGALAKNGHPREAVELVAPVYDLARHDPTTGTNLIQAWREIGEEEKARLMWHRLDALPKPHPTLPELGWMLDRLRSK